MPLRCLQGDLEEAREVPAHMTANAPFLSLTHPGQGLESILQQKPEWI